MATETLESFGKAEKKFLDNLKTFAASGYRFSDDHSLYKPSQKEGFQGYIEGLGQGHKHGYIELPTGVGKTALFISLIKNYLEAANGSENAPRVLIAVPTEKLAVQTAKSFAKFMPEIAKTIEADGDEGQEIDWEKSDIGLQYSKMKHAHKKPKVLITTYQSLARDTANTVYPPEEYGYVIYDEGHVITAPTFGKAVEKFKDSIQLAVSATPEYTETKTVASRLPHRYYQLPLAEAINRGDLCNVRPAIIKTGYKIDEALFQKFMEQQGGTPLNEGQLQQFLNQEARNKAVIETYLRGADPDSGERYFGQNGMIFCTGVKHADSITEQFKKTLENPGDGQALQSWLDREGVELIAPVHGQTKGAWLKKNLLPNKTSEQRKFQGAKEWYTEEEIFDLHERGKILLLASVAKLKWGFDSPRDSLLFDLADRFSKVDATQIDGRAFRLDPEDPDKVATVFNLMDENTEELYAKYPKMIPIYCAEVIEGAEFRPPAKRRGAQVRFKEHPPGMEKSLQEAGFYVVTDIDAVRTISRNNKMQRDEARKKAPDKGDWASGEDMKRIYVGASGRFVSLFERYAIEKKALLVAEGKEPEEAAAIIEREFVGMRNPGNIETLCASPTVVAELMNRGELKHRDNNAPPKGNWLAGANLEKIYIGSHDKFSQLLERYRLEKLENLIAEGNTEEEAAIIIDRDYVGLRSSGGFQVQCASSEAIAELVSRGELKERSRKLLPKSDWVSSADLLKVYVGAPTKYIGLFERYADEKKASLVREGKTQQEAAAIVERDFVAVRNVNGIDRLCVSPLMAAKIISNEKLREKSSKAPAKEDWVSGADLVQTYIGTASKFNTLFEQFVAEKVSALKANGKTHEEAVAIVDRDFVGARCSINAEALCASPAAVAELISRGKLRDKGSKAPTKGDWISSKDITSTHVGEPKKFIGLFQNYAAEKQAALVADGKTPQEAKEIVERDFVGIRSSSGNETICVSPVAIAELDQALKLNRRDIAQTFAEKVGKRDIAPGSHDLKRTGRVRKADES